MPKLSNQWASASKYFTLLGYNSLEEIEIRANTIVSVEMIKEEINKNFNRKILSLEVDFVLWNVGEEKRKSLVPHHRTLTIFY